MTNVRFDDEGRLMVWVVNVSDERVMADEMDAKTGEAVTLVCERSWGGGAQWCGCWIRSSGGGVTYYVKNGDVELEKYGTLAQASKSAYLPQFRELSKMADAKHKERKMLRKFRLYQLKSLKDNTQTLPDGRTWSQVLANAASGNVFDMLKLAESYATGVPEGKIPQRPKESLGWYLRAAVCGSVDAMTVVVRTFDTGACEGVDATVATYWREKLSHVASAENATTMQSI